MTIQIVHETSRDDENIHAKKAALEEIRSILAELELELADLKASLEAFESRYLREVGALYAELDEWNARIAELVARQNPTADATRQAEEARRHARSTYEAAHGDRAEKEDFNPSPDLKKRFREVAKRIHPDLASDPADRVRRTRLMADANRAYQAGDAEVLGRILDEYEAGVHRDEMRETELNLLTRQITQANERIAEIKREMAVFRESEIFKLKRDSEKASGEGRDLLSELAASIKSEIELARQRHDAMAEANR
jgi:hypothetical protein